MKNVLYLFFALFYFKVGSQTYIFTYGKIPAKSDEELSEIKENDIRASFVSIMNSLNEVSYELIVSNNYAKFRHVEQLYSPTFNKRAISWYGGDVPYYYNKKDEKVVYVEQFNSQNYLVEKNIYDNKWVLTQEMKIINGYTCFKAIQHKITNDIRGNFSFTEVAWFCPEFPFPFGPHDFFGLPGVVFEAYTENTYVKYVLKQIATKETNTVIKFPEGKTISESEINAIFEKYIQGFKYE